MAEAGVAEATEDGAEFLLVGQRQVVGRGFGLFFGDAAERIHQRMELVVEVIECVVHAFAAFGFGGFFGSEGGGRCEGEGGEGGE